MINQILIIIKLVQYGGLLNSMLPSLSFRNHLILEQCVRSAFTVFFQELKAAGIERDS